MEDQLEDAQGPAGDVRFTILDASTTTGNSAFDRVFRALPATPARWLSYRRGHGRGPSLRNPQNYTEKVNWRVLYDRRPELTLTCDKLASKKLAETVPGLRVPRTYWSGADLRDLVGVPLPSRWVCKPNNGSGRVMFGSDTVTAADLEYLLPRTADWLNSIQLNRLREWGYTNAAAVFLVEEFVDAGTHTPDDFKVYLFDGKPKVIQHDVSRFGTPGRRFYDPDWNVFNVTPSVARAELIAQPSQFQRMLDYAISLGGGFDAMRVDFFLVGDDVWFGEFAAYPGSGLVPWKPSEMNELVGSWWTLPTVTR